MEFLVDQRDSEGTSCICGSSYQRPNQSPCWYENWWISTEVKKKEEGMVTEKKRIAQKRKERKSGARFELSVFRVFSNPAIVLPFPIPRPVAY